MTLLRLAAAAALGLTLSLTAMTPAAFAATKITVNGEPISDLQIDARVKLFRLEGKSGADGAREELITEALQLQEAKRLGIVVTDSEVENAVQSVARNLKVSTDKLYQILAQAAVSVDTFKSRMRAAIAWQKIQQMAIAPQVQLSDVELDQQAAAELDEQSSFDYILKEVLFVMPQSGGNASRRTSEANAYRKSFGGCDSAVQLSLSYTDAAVRDLGRRHATQLPEAIADELAGLNVGGISKPRVVEGGVSMLAICSKTAARDTTFIKNNLRQKAGNEAMKAEAEEYLADLRKKARIVFN
jgi:peptidyl-prolyl cis-trans isomerase SurA